MPKKAKRTRGLFAAAALTSGLAGLGALPATAQNNDVFSCRASAARVSSGTVSVEPVRANDQAVPCSTQSTVAVIAQNPTAPPSFDASAQIAAAGAYTSRATSGVGALAGLGRSSGRVGTPAGPQSAAFRSAHVSVTWRCVAGLATPAASSQIVGLTINGVDAPVPPGAQSIPLLGEATLHVNRVQRTGNVATVRALELEHPQGGSVVLAEAAAGYDGGVAAACQDLAGRASGNSPRPCPRGSAFDPDSGNCVIREGGQAVVVGKPFEGPQGGSVITLAEARRRYPGGPCVKGSRPNFVLLGTNGNDDITGTARGDRILMLAGGRDEGEGGNGGDCIDGGSGRDVISGAAGADRLYGGAGDDALNTGYGRDSAYGGTGDDAINAATAGRVVRVVGCGSGRDTVRINRDERRRVRKDCERVLVLVR